MENRVHFIDKAEALIIENISNEHFGVSELADAMHMSRSNLLRKIKKQTQLSASQYIRQIRLKEGKELLEDSSLTVSEVSHQVGFGSPSYFIKCFREHYGHSPGEHGNVSEIEQPQEPEVLTEPSQKRQQNKKLQWPLLAGIVIAVVTGFWFLTPSTTEESPELEKSIAVLPFRNESTDANNGYFVNGLMESTLGNLQRIEDLLVISRTSSESYRNTDMTIPEIAKELNVSYLVEGSGQRIGNQVLLNIKLIAAETDTPIWSGEYQEEVDDLFTLQKEVAQKIAFAIEATVTPSALQQLQKVPTENMVAYDHYLKGMELLNTREQNNMLSAIQDFEAAINEDGQFAQAYAQLAITYYLLEQFKKEKRYTEKINTYADKALLYDPKNDLSLTAKAFYYMNTAQYRLAVPHLEKALEYNPNSVTAVQLLSLLYSNFIPNTTKYLKNALKGLRLDMGGTDNSTQSYVYLNLSNALAQNGFSKEALNAINKTLELDSANYFASYLKVYIKYALDGDLERAKNGIVSELKKDSTRLDLLQEAGKMHYFLKEYDKAFRYYKSFVDIREKNALNLYPHEDLRIGLVYDKMGFTEEAQTLYDSYAAYCDTDESIYSNASNTFRYIHEGDLEKAMQHLKSFANETDYQYWLILFLEKDPLINTLKEHPDYQPTVEKIHRRFWENHDRLKLELEENRLL